MTEIMSQSSESLPQSPVFESETTVGTDLLVPVSDMGCPYNMASGVRQKVLKNWSQGDQIPLSKVGKSRPQKAPKPKKESPNRKNAARDQLNSEDYNNYIQHIDDTIETIVKSSDSEADTSQTSSVNDLWNGTINGLSVDSNINSFETKTEEFKRFNGNEFKNILNENINQKSRRISEKWPKVEKKTRKRSANEVKNQILSLPSDSNNILYDILPKGVNTFNTNKDMDMKPKRAKRCQKVGVPKLPTPLPIKTSSLFKSSINSCNPYLNSFQKFLTIKSDPLNTESNDNTFSVNKLKKYRKPKSETQMIAKKKVNQLRGIKSSSYIKIRRSRTKPLVIKNLTQQKSFLDFVSKKFPPIKEGVPFIQDRSCDELAKEYWSSNLNYCLDCNDKKGNSQTCRFFQYRTIIKNGHNLCVYAFAEEGNATHDDCKIWLPVSRSQSLDEITARYLLTFVGQQLCRIYREEQHVAQRYTSLTWKKPVKGIRELCDVCDTTIFNTHYVCQKCGLAVCMDCFHCRESQTQSQIYHIQTRKSRDDFGWILCTDKQPHDLSHFHLAIFVTHAVFGSIDKTYHKIRNEKQILGLCDCEQILPQLNVDLRQQLTGFDITNFRKSQVPRQWLCDQRLLILTDPKCRENINLFQLYWLKGYPVIVEGVNNSLDPELWTPKSFGTNFGKKSSFLVNCMTGLTIPKRPMSDFWDGFEDVDQRLLDEQTREVMILKLKDWPPNAEFRDILPLWFDNLMDALPLQEYTRYNGSRNLASRLPEFFVRPDLGPKMYCAYGSVLHPEKGTTNLHLDMSDAINVMIYVGVAQRNNIPLQEHLDEANDTLLKGGCDQEMMARANSVGLKVGALWHIWKAEDADKIRQFLKEVAKERHKRIDVNDDPIHDQLWYLDQNLRTRLENECNVKGLAIAQCLGDAILVPAGAPHQVQNIHSCIKVAGEFVSPENVAHCLTMTQQFRNLSKRHNNHEDKLQIKNIIYHTIKDSLSVLLPSNPDIPNYFQIPSPPKLVSQTPPDLANENSMESSPQTPPQPNDMNETNSSDITLKPFSSDNKENNEIKDNSNMNLEILENSSDVRPTSPPPQESTTECITNAESVDNKTNSVNSMGAMECCCAVQMPEVCVKSIETEPKESESSESSQVMLCPPSLKVPSLSSSSDTLDNSLSSPPILTPFNASDDSILSLTVTKTKDTPLDSSQRLMDRENPSNN